MYYADSSKIPNQKVRFYIKTVKAFLFRFELKRNKNKKYVLYISLEFFHFIRISLEFLICPQTKFYNYRYCLNITKKI